MVYQRKYGLTLNLEIVATPSGAAQYFKSRMAARVFVQCRLQVDYLQDQ